MLRVTGDPIVKTMKIVDPHTDLAGSALKLQFLNYGRSMPSVTAREEMCPHGLIVTEEKTFSDSKAQPIIRWCRGNCSFMQYEGVTPGEVKEGAAPGVQ